MARNLAPALSQPHHHADRRLQPPAIDRVRVCQVGPDAPRVARDHDHETLLYTFVIALANPAVPLLAAIIADRVHRKWQLVGSCACLAIFGLIFSQRLRRPPASSSWVVLITFSTTNLSYSFQAFQAELYPTRIRSRSIGFTCSWSRFSTIFVGFMVAFFLRNYGTIGVFGFIAAAMLAFCLVIGLMGPQTARLQLEQISR